MRTYVERDNRFINRGIPFETGEVFWVFHPWHIASDRRTIVIVDSWGHTGRYDLEHNSGEATAAGPRGVADGGEGSC